MNARDHSGIGMTSARTRDRLVARLREEGIGNEAVLERIRSTPRHLFVDEALASRAYENNALPIGYGQTISQPYIVALMTEALIADLPPGETLGKVLEIGTGCGYQTAILAPFAQHIYSIERIRPLYQRASERLRNLDVKNVTLRCADGFQGWQSQAPFDAIIVAAAPAEIPQVLLDQLADGGKLVIPVGGRGAQGLVCVTRQGDEFRRRELGLVSFVPLVEGVET
ncbi:MAG TPA: protein-L-isoaspartate(D-aspartate) O-methyltransferase [Gammaproteobacteria bacterium]